MKALVTDLYTQADLDAMNQKLSESITIAQSKGVTLDLKTREERRKMGTARQGYAALILPIATNNINSLPRDKDPRRLADLMAARQKISNVRGLAQKMLEWADDTEMAIGIDAVALADSLAASLQNARRDNDSLDNEMKEVDEYNSRFGRQMTDEDTDPDAGSTPTP